MSSVPSSSSLIVFSVTAYMLSNLSLNCLILIIISFSLLGDMTDSSFKYAFLLLIFSSLFYLFLKKKQKICSISISKWISQIFVSWILLSIVLWALTPHFFFLFKLIIFFHCKQLDSFRGVYIEILWSLRQKLGPQKMVDLFLFFSDATAHPG